jgi:hypothetical protein
MIKPQKSDAAESNAGDDFHILWTVRKAIGLLNFNKDGLKRISIEGLDYADKAIEDPDGDICLGVDLTEYYGGKDVKSAKRVIISQLKYSTRHPNLEWTASRVCAGRKGTSGSIIHRLATLFKGLSVKTDRKVILKKLKIKLVSNRPASSSLLQAINAVQKILSTNPVLTNASLKKLLDSKQVIEIKKIEKASLLKGQQFVDFLRVLDFSDCHVDSRYELKQNLIRSISQLGSVDAKEEYSVLKELVGSKMMPEAKRRNSLTQTEVLYAFKRSDLSDLFPAPSHFESQNGFIVREQISSIIKEIKRSNSLIVLHGGAGIGKSTITNQIQAHLPRGSVSVVYDCYGGGAYLNSDDRRHRHENVFMQLSNELAQLAGSPFLLIHQPSDTQYIRAFKKRLTEACDIIRKSSPSAIVAIIIDAADNSVTAATQKDEHSFVQDLITMQLPPGSRLIVTSRTERLASLKLPDSCNEIEIKSFSNQETETFLLQAGYTPSSKEVESFKKFTYATPRVMSYALSMPGITLREKLKPLKPGGKNLDDIFKFQIQDAIKRSGNKQAIEGFLKYVITLPRPVPVNYLMKLGSVNKNAVQDISSDLWKGFIHENGKFSFRDEDFETYIRKTYQAGTKEYDTIADLFLQEATSQEYASINLAFALSHAGRKDQLLDIVLEQKFLKLPLDPIKNKEVFVERTRQAMRHCTEADHFKLLQLQMVAAEAAKTNQAIENILVNHPELASSYGNLETNQKLYFKEGNPGWFGRVHFRSAAIFSRSAESYDLAQQHLEKAREWCRYRDKLKDERADKFPLNARDIAYGAEAVLRLSGPKRCIQWLEGWQPKEAVREAAKVLIKTLIETSDEGQLKDWFKGQSFCVEIQLHIVKLFFDHGMLPPVSISDTLKILRQLKKSKQKPDVSVLKSLLSFCEYALMRKTAYRVIEPYLNLIDVSPPEYAPRFFDKAAREIYTVDLLFRKAVIKSIYSKTKLAPADFYPEKLIKELSDPENKYRENRLKRELDDLYKHILPMYETRAAFLLKRGTTESRSKKLTETLKALDKDWEFSYKYQRDLPHLYRFLSVKLLDIVFYTTPLPAINAIKSSFLIRKKSNIDLQLSIAGRISLNKTFEKQVLIILAEADTAIQDASVSAGQKVDYLKEATVIASRVSKSAGKEFFDKMVSAANEIDLDAFDQIKSIDAIAGVNQFNQPKLANDFARYVEYCGKLLADWDHFPWDEGIKGIAKLDISSAFSVLCRWDHRHSRDISDHFVHILKAALRQGYIDHLTAASLLPINKFYWPTLNELYALILEGFDRSGDHTRKNVFIKTIFRDIQLYSSGRIDFLEGFIELIEAGKYLDRTLLEEIRGYCNRVFSMCKSPKEPTHKTKHKSNILAEKRAYTKYVKLVDISNSEQIRTFIQKLRKRNKYGYFNEDLACELLQTYYLS